MADVNKSVEITLRANLKQLEEGLKNIPNMTKSEAKAMTRALSSEFNKAQKAAKKAAEESKKAAKATSRSYQQTANSVGASMDKIATDAKVSAHEIKISFLDAESGAANLSQNADAVSVALGGTTTVIQGLMPGLYESSKGALDLANSLGGVAAQAAAGGPITIKLTVALVAASAAYNLYSRQTRLAAAQQERLAKAQAAATKKLDEQFHIATGITSEFNTLNREYKLLTGEISQLDFDLATAREISLSKEREELTLQQKRIEEQERLLPILEKARKSKSLLSDAERELLNTAMATSKNALVKQGIDMNTVTADIALIAFKGELLKRIEKERLFAAKISERRAETLEKEQEIIRLKAEINKETQEEEDRLERQEELEARRLENAARMQEIQSVGISISEQRLASEDRGRQMIIDTLEPIERSIGLTAEKVIENERLEESIRQQIQSAQELAQTDDDRAAAAQVKAEGEAAIAALVLERQAIERNGELEIEELRKENAEKEEQRQSKLAEQRRKDLQELLENMNMMQQGTIGTFANTVQTMTTLAESASRKNKDIIMALFAAQRIAAVGEVAFNTAKAITAAQAYPPPFNGLMIASAVAAGAAQTATIFAQQAPQFHMGGMTPDESIAVVKAGEAVLDRATVDRLGGEPGVNRLQNGQGGSPEVIVMNPYKHFDRYMTDRQRAGLSSRSARRGY